MLTIEAKQLTKFYGMARGIVDVDLSVAEGDFFGFIGPNGAGKSTLIRTLLGLIAPTRGSAAIFGRDIITHRIENLKDVGYLPSETAFYHGMRVAEVLKLSAELRGLDCGAQAKSLAERLQLDMGKKIEELSFGNRKKVGIICALQHKPRLYILDEPTSGLDPLVQKEFYTILQERNRAGATVFLSSHILTEIATYCQSAAVIRDGRLLVADSVKKLGHTGVKHVTLHGMQAAPEIPQSEGMKFEDGTVSFLFSGAPSDLLQVLSSLSFADITVTDPSLDEIFLHYYQTGEAAQ